MFKLIAENIYKLDIPFENITTSSFLVTGDKNILIDCGTYPSDVTEIIMPALKKLKSTIFLHPTNIIPLAVRLWVVKP